MTRINKILVFFVLAGCWIIVDSELTTAQNAYPVSETLPPPPPAYNPIPTPTVVPVELAPVAPISTPAIREYNFEAPQSPEVLVPQNRTVNPSNHSSNSPAIAILYRVEVSGDNEFVLSKVKLIEPLAFVRPGEGVIQAGLFPQQRQAEERVRKLENQGLSVKVVPVSDRLGASRHTRMQRQVR